MLEISKEYARNNQLKQIGVIQDTDMSKVILKMERLKEDKTIKYYCMDFIVYEQARDKANIEVSFWGEEND